MKFQEKKVDYIKKLSKCHPSDIFGQECVALVMRMWLGLNWEITNYLLAPELS